MSKRLKNERWWEREDFDDLTMDEKLAFLANDGAELMGPGPDGEFREVRENVRKYVKGEIQWIKTYKEVPSPINSTPVRIDSSTQSTAETSSSQAHQTKPTTSNAPGGQCPSSKTSRPQKKSSTSVKQAEQKISKRGAFSSDSENEGLTASIPERPTKALRKKQKIITSTKDSSIYLSDSVSDQITSTEMDRFVLPPVEVTKESPKRKEKKKKDNASRKRIADDPLVLMKRQTRRKPNIITPKTSKKRQALTLAEGIPTHHSSGSVSEEHALKKLFVSVKRLPQETINRSSPKTSDFDTPDPSKEDARPQGWNATLNTRVTQTSAGSSANSFDLFHESTPEEKNDVILPKKSEKSKKKAADDKGLLNSAKKKPKFDNGLPDFSDNTPEPSQDTVPYQPVVSSAPQRKSKSKVDFTDSDSEKSHPPSPDVHFHSRRSGKELVHCLSSDNENEEEEARDSGSSTTRMPAQPKPKILKKRRPSITPKQALSSSSDEDELQVPENLTKTATVNSFTVIPDTPKLENRPKRRIFYKPRPSQSSDEDQQPLKNTVIVNSTIVISDSPETHRKESNNDYDSYKDHDYRESRTSTATKTSPQEVSHAEHGAFSNDSDSEDCEELYKQGNRSFNLPTTALRLNTSATLAKRTTRTATRPRTVSTRDSKRFDSSSDEVKTTESDIQRRGDLKKVKRKRRHRNYANSWLNVDEKNPVEDPNELPIITAAGNHDDAEVNSDLNSRIDEVSISQPNEAKTNENSEEKSNRPREGAIKRRHNIPPRPDSPENTEFQNMIADEQEDSVVQPGEVDLDSQPAPVIVRNSRRKPRPRRDS